MLIFVASLATQVIALLLLIAGTGKLRDRRAFQELIGNYGAIPPLAVPTLAWILPPTELLLAASLAFPPSRGIGATATSFLFAIAALVIGGSLFVGRVPKSCGCVVGEGPPTRWTVARALGLSAIAGVAAFAPWGTLPIQDELITWGFSLTIVILSWTATTVWAVRSVSDRAGGGLGR